MAYVEIPETGHMLPVEAPDELAGAIVDWLRGLSGWPGRFRVARRRQVGRVEVGLVVVFVVVATSTRTTSPMGVPAWQSPVT